MSGYCKKYDTKAGKRWRVIYDGPPDPETGKRRQRQKRGFTRERDAQRFLRDQLASVEDGSYVARSRITVAEYLRKWLDGIRVKPTTLSAYRSSAETYVIPRLGGKKLQALSAEDLDALYRWMEREGGRNGQGLKPKTVRHAHTVVHRALHDAVERGHVVRNVAELANPPTQKQTRSRAAKDRVWSGEELGGFLTFVRRHGAGRRGDNGEGGHRLYAAWHLLATTGMRRAELLGLRWSDVDLGASTLRAGEQTVTMADGPPDANGKRRRVVVWQDDGKTDSAGRTIALDDETVTVLRDHRTRQLAERMAYPGEWNTGHGELVFTNDDGTGIHPERFSAWHLSLVRRAGMRVVDVHGMRHSYATASLRAGVSPEVLSARLGHADVAITLNIYAHVRAGDDAQAAARAAAAIFGEAAQ